MANRVLLWPEASREEAVAWVVAANIEWRANYDPDSAFTNEPFLDDGVLKIDQDRFGQWKASYWGAPYELNLVVIVEPSALLALRPSSVIASTWEPVEE